MMNNIMPIMSAVFCFSLPAGVGLYWVASAVVRSIQQVLVNKHIDKTDFDQLIEKNKDKAKKKQDKRIKRMEKAGIDPKTINQYASMNTRNVQSTTPKSNSISTKASSAKASMTQEEKEEAVKKATEMYNQKAPKPGSIAAKANMVKIYNENNNKTEKVIPIRNKRKIRLNVLPHPAAEWRKLWNSLNLLPRQWMMPLPQHARNFL